MKKVVHSLIKQDESSSCEMMFKKRKQEQTKEKKKDARMNGLNVGK